MGVTGSRAEVRPPSPEALENIEMSTTRTPWGRWMRSRGADLLSVVAVVVAMWAPAAELLDKPLVGASAGIGLLCCAGAGTLDPANRRAPAAFIFCLLLCGSALLIHAVTR
jgi:hypothetical protein